MIEKNGFSRKIFILLIVTGITISFYFLYSLIIHGSWAQIIENHIFYSFYISFYQIKQKTIALLYCIPVVGSFFIASIPILKFFGLALLASILITSIFWKLYFTSVWCFFSALLSIMVTIALKQINNSSGYLD